MQKGKSMSKDLSFFGIYPEAINDAVDQCEIAMSNCGFNSDDIEYMYMLADEELEHFGVWANITNSIIEAYFTVTKEFIKNRFPEKEVEFYVNGSDSHFYIDGEEQI